MASGPHEPNDAVSAAAQRFKERRDQQRAEAEAEAATKARQEEGNQSPEDSHTRNVLVSAAIVALLVGAGWFMLNLMRCDDRYSAISGFLFHECR